MNAAAPAHPTAAVRPGQADTTLATADRAIRVSTALAVLAVATIAAYVSYWHAYAVVRVHGESGVTARMEPFTIDGLVYASSMVILYSARHQLRVPRLARWALTVGIAATLAANVAQGLSDGPTSAVVAAWPAVSLVLSYELLLWMVRTAATRGPAAERGDPEPIDIGSGGLYFADQTTDQETVGADALPQDGNEVDIDAAAVALYRTSVEAGSPLPERKLCQMFGKTSRRWARNRIADARTLAIAEPIPVAEQPDHAESAASLADGIAEGAGHRGIVRPVTARFELGDDADYP